MDGESRPTQQGRNIKDNLKMIAEKARGSTGLQMVKPTKASGRTIFSMEKESKCMQMDQFIRELGRMMKNKEVAQ